MLFAHGYATNQGVWRHVAPAFTPDHRVICFDHVGSGRSDRAAFDPQRHRSLHGFAEDVIELIEGLELEPVIFVGHSVSAMIGALAAGRRPDLFRRLIMVGPSARFLDDEGYVGGFDVPAVDALLERLNTDFAGWVRAMAPPLIGSEDAALATELEGLLLETTDATAIAMAQMFMRMDHRDDLEAVEVPTLVMQMANDPLVPVEVGRYVESRLPDGHFVQLAATGHFPSLSRPAEMIAAIRAFL